MLLVAIVSALLEEEPKSPSAVSHFNIATWRAHLIDPLLHPPKRHPLLQHLIGDEVAASSARGGKLPLAESHVLLEAALADSVAITSLFVPGLVTDPSLRPNARVVDGTPPTIGHRVSCVGEPWGL